MKKKILFIIIFLSFLETSFSFTQRNFFEEGKNAFQSKNYSLAIDLFKKALREKENEEDVFFYLAMSYYQNGDYKDALNYFLNLINRYPETRYKEQTTFYMGLTYYRLKDYETALNRLRRYIVSYPKGRWVKDARFTIPYILMLMNQYTQAAKEWEGFIKDFQKDEKSIEASLRLGQCYFYDENYKKALPIFESFIEKNKNSTFYDEALFFTGKTYYFLNNFEKAALLFDSQKDKKNFIYYEDVLYFGGSSFVKLKKFRESLVLWEPLTNSKEYGEEINYKIGIIYRDLKEYDTSISFLSNALTISKDEIFIRKIKYEISITLYEKGSLKDSLVILEDLQKKEDEITPMVLQKIGEIYLLQKNYEKAENLFSLIIDKYNNPNVIKETFYKRAKLYFERKNYEKSIKDIEIYLSKNLTDDEKAEAYLLMGDCYIELKQYENAANSYLKISLLKSSYPFEKVLYLTGWAFARAEKYDNAKVHFEKIIKTSKDRKYIALAYYNLGIIEYNKKNYDEAKRIFNELYENYKDTEYFEEASIKIGWIYFKEEKFKLLIDYLNKINLKDSWDYLNLKGWGYFRLGEYKKAIDNFTNSLIYAKDISSSNDSLIAIAKSYYNLNDFGVSFSYFEEAYNLSYKAGIVDNFPSLLSEMAWTLIKSGQLKKATSYYEELIEKYPDSPYTSESLFKLAEYYYNLSDFKMALKYYQKIIDINKDENFVSLSYYWAGWCYWNIGNKNKAIEIFEKYITLFPKGEYAPDVLLRISTIYYEWNNLKMSKETLERLIKNYPSSYEAEKAKLLLSEINIKDQSQGNEEEYYKLLLKEAKTKEAKASILLKLANLYKERNKKEEAIKYYQEVIENTNKDEAAYANLEIAFYDIDDGKYNEAIEKLTSIFSVYKFASLYPKALYGIALSYSKLGKTETAKRYIQRLKDNYPSDEWTKKASQILK